MKKLVTSLSCFLVLNIYANSEVTSNILDKNFKVTLDWLEQKPKSYAKDFFIIQYLKESGISEEDSTSAYNMARNKNGRVKKAYNKKVSTIPPEDLLCYRAKTKDLLQKDSRCLALGLSISESTVLSQKQLNNAISKLNDYPTLKNDLKVIASNQPFLSLLETKPHRFYRLFFKAGKDFRFNEINHPIPKSFIDSISVEKDFNKFVRYIVPNNKYNKLQKSLFNVKDNKELTHQTLFFLAMNAANHDKEELALNYLEKAYKKAYYQMDKDKVVFWQYLVSKDNKHLESLISSWDNNIYSLYAKELSGVKPENIIHSLETFNKPTSFDIYNQFEWIKVLDDTRKSLDEKKMSKYQNIFTDENTLPHYVYLLEKFNKYRIQYFITPFKSILDNYTTEEKVLIYSIGRQESRFIPSSISFATAQGVMQIMPFLSKALAKQLKEPYNIYEQFDPKVNIKYANKHLKVLKKQFYNNPLFIAYAYNGGPGYTRGQFKRGLFKKQGKYEPFLSMELISYNETRKYGKKVLANYYIYNNYLNKENSVKLSSIFQKLILPN